MRREQLYTILLKAAEISHRTELVVIGSQALLGSVQDLEIAVVLNSADVDFYTVVPISSATWEELMLELGQDSDFHLQHEIYVKEVPSNLRVFRRTGKIAPQEKRSVRIWFADRSYPFW